MHSQCTQFLLGHLGNTFFKPPPVSFFLFFLFFLFFSFFFFFFSFFFLFFLLFFFFFFLFFSFFFFFFLFFFFFSSFSFHVFLSTFLFLPSLNFSFFLFPSKLCQSTHSKPPYNTPCHSKGLHCRFRALQLPNTATTQRHYQRIFHVYFSTKLLLITSSSVEQRLNCYFVPSQRFSVFSNPKSFQINSTMSSTDAEARMELFQNTIASIFLSIFKISTLIKLVRLLTFPFEINSTLCSLS